MFAFSALMPVLFLAFWIQQDAFTQQMNLVRDRHLLLDRNLAGALSRYAIDLEAIMIERLLSRSICKPILSTVEPTEMVANSSPGMLTKINNNSLVLELDRLCSSFYDMVHQV